MRKLLISLALLNIILVVSSAAVKNPKRIFLNNREPPPPPAKSTRAVETLWIEQKVDNFDSANNETWDMRYMANNEHFQPGGPIFIYVGGEWTISPGWIQGGHTYDMAAERNGYLFYTEHRYYGISYPVPDTSVENLQYLNVEQALADLAYFITYIKSTIPGLENSGVILVGGSYSASMVTWFSQIYPDLVDGVWSSSAPLEAKIDFYEYTEVVGKAFTDFGGEECYTRIENAFAEMEQAIIDNNSIKLENAFNLCGPLDVTNNLDVWSFFSAISNSFKGLVQYMAEGDIESTCSMILTGDDDFEGVTNWIIWYYGLGNYCLSVGYDSTIDFYRNTEWNHPANEWARQWIFQTCNEYGWFQTSNSTNHPLGSSFPATLQITECEDLYDNLFDSVSIESKIDNTNILHGALTPVVRNVYSTHGQYDPWRPAGVQTDINESSETVIIPLVSHCADLGSISEWDSPAMIASKERINELVSLWLL